MATRGSIPKMMEQAGIDMLDPAVGIPVVRRELTHATEGEVLIAGGLGVLLDPVDGDGGIESAASELGPMVGTFSVDPDGILTVHTTLDPARQPFLYDHAIDGTPVLPGVMGIEAFAEVASLVAPGWTVAEISDVEFAAPFKFYRSEPRALTITAIFTPVDGGLVARCELTGERLLPGRDEPARTTHFTASVTLVRQPIEARRTDVPAPPQGVAAPDIYKVYFHGPSYQVLQSAALQEGYGSGLMATDLPVDREPSDSPLLMEPRLIELCFQTAGVWELASSGRFALPRRVAHVRALPAEAVGRLTAVVSPNDEGVFSAEVIDEAGNVLVEMAGYETVEIPGMVDDAALEPIRAAHGVTGQAGA
jgi:hypothetical protein